MIRDCEIDTIQGSDIGPESAWSEIAAGRLIQSATSCEFGMAEEVIGLLRFADGTFEVGVGESLRPYEKLHGGDKEDLAEEMFWQAVMEHATGS